MSADKMLEQLLQSYITWSEPRPAAWTDDMSAIVDMSPAQIIYANMSDDQKVIVKHLLEVAVSGAISSVLAYLDGISGEGDPPRLIDSNGKQYPTDLYDQFLGMVDRHK